MKAIVCPKYGSPDLLQVQLIELLESGKIMPVIDGCYPLSKIVEAFLYFEKEHPKGKVVVTML